MIERMTLCAGLVLTGVFAVEAADAHESGATPTEHVYGHAGTLVLQGTAGLGWSSNTRTPDVGAPPNAPETKVSTTTVTLDPVVDYFVVQNVSLGIVIGLGYENSSVTTGGQSAGGTSTFLINPGLRVGYNIPITADFSFHPVLGFTYQYATIKNEFPPGNNPSSEKTTASDIAIALNPQFLAHLGQHFFLIANPRFQYAFAGKISNDQNPSTIKTSTIDIALLFGFGGWLKL